MSNQDGVSLEVIWSDDPICPHCGYVEKGWWEWADDEDGRKTCGGCDVEYAWTKAVMVRFETKPLELKPL